MTASRLRPEFEHIVDQQQLISALSDATR